MENVEIERKYLVKSDIYRSLAVAKHEVKQGYLCADGIRTVRVRLWDDQGVLTIKGRGNGVSRFEWEKTISSADAEALFALCQPGRVEKTRYVVPIAGTTLNVEVDVFHGDNEGLVLAEIELPSEDYVFEVPEWLGKEVTGDPRYYNSYISAHPFNTWQE
jgi:adenylate cyclase